MIPKFLSNSLTILQLENYELRRFWYSYWNRLFDPTATHRQKTVWTKKMKLIVCLSIAIQLSLLSFLIYSFGFKIFGLTAGVAIIFFLFPIWLSLSTIILRPLESIVKIILVRRAASYIKKFPKLTIIGVAGSYGKTTTKELLARALKDQVNLVSTSESINTPIGISRLILSEVNANTEVLLVEMGEHTKGDIAELCSLTKPDIGIITGINQAHLERMGDLSVTASTIFELAEFANKNAKLVLNGDDDNIRKFSPKFTNSNNISWYGTRDSKTNEYRIVSQTLKPGATGQDIVIVDSENTEYRLETKVIAPYIAEIITGVLIVFKHLGLNVPKAMQSLSEMSPIPHRLEPIFSPNNILVIDDSYNGNPTGAEQAIKLLGSFTDRRKIYVTPGLVELGKESAEIHMELGQRLARIANLVFLSQNSTTEHIVAGLKKEGFLMDHVIIKEDSLALHSAVQKTAEPGDVILFQNDWTDNYI